MKRKWVNHNFFFEMEEVITFASNDEQQSWNKTQKTDLESDPISEKEILLAKKDK